MRRKNPISHSYTIIALIAVILMAGSFMAYSLYGSSNNSDEESASINQVRKSSSSSENTANPSNIQPITLHSANADIQPAINPNEVIN